MNIKKLTNLIAYKVKCNHIYFNVINDVVKEDLKLNTGQIILCTSLNTDDNEAIFSILSIDESSNEGVIKLKYSDIAVLLLANKIKAYYTQYKSEDNEIKKLINS